MLKTPTLTEQKTNYSKLIILLIYLHFFSLLFQNVKIYFWGVYINIPNISFLIIFSIFLIYCLSKKIKFFFSKLDFLIFFPIILILLNFNFLDKENFLLSLLINSYIFCLYIFYKSLFLNNYKGLILDIIKKISLLLSIIGIFGWLYFQINFEDSFVLSMEYPIKIFHSARAKSLFSHPNYLFIFLTLSFFIFFDELIKNRNIKSISSFLTISICLILTFSKSLVIIFAISLLFISKKLVTNNFIKKTFYMGFLFGLVFYLFFSHLIIVSNKSENYEYYTSGRFVTNKDNSFILKLKNYEVFYNNYFFLKKVGIEIAKQNLILGNGELSLLNFKSEDIDLMNKYTKNKINNHHSQYFNLLSNKGILSLLIYIIILFMLFKKNNINKISFYKNYIIWIIFEGFFTDLNSLNFIWLFMALVESDDLKNRKKII